MAFASRDGSVRDGVPDDAPTDDALTDDALTDDALTGSFRILQRKKGHRFSVDDVLTAREACEAATTHLPAEGDPLHIDLGCGIGSVLLMVHERLRWRGLGVEAQSVSIGLARQNLSRNELGSRLSLIESDFREVTLDERASLVTGTPPYFPVGSAIPSPDSQRAYARIEYRGGVEDYLETAARWADPLGVIVVCGDARKPERVSRTAERLGLCIDRQLDAYPREGRPSLFSIWTIRANQQGWIDRWPIEPWTARDRNGARTKQAHELREYFGLEPNLDEHPSP